jgi:RHS repeat-associated protein
MSFDPWGQRRNLQNYQFIEGDVLAAFDSSITTRGFTGHEMVDGVGIIHMNGRIYDGKIGRFLQADPFIQAPFDTQSLNRYSYVRNNPLNKTDPSGYFWEAAVAAVYWAVGTYVVTDLLITLGAENLAALASIAGCAAGNVDTCAGASFGSNYAFTYDFGKASRAAAISYYSADLYGKAGNVTDTIGNAIANGFVGGIAAELGGGDFGDGFLSAGVSALAKPYIRGIGTDQHSGSRVAVRAILGGTISELTGGKFANGAVSAAMAQLFNAEKTRASEKGQGPLIFGLTYGEGKHLYGLATDLCSTSECNPDQVFLDVNKWSIPFNITGDYSDGFHSLLGLPFESRFDFLTPNPIQHTSNAKERTSTNLALPGHLFKGTVVHRVSVRGDRVIVSTIGTGTAGSNLNAKFNNVVGIAGFLPVHYLLQAKY